MTQLLIRGIHKDGRPFEARIVEGQPTNDRDRDNSVVVEVCHGGRSYRRRWNNWIWAQASLARRCSSIEDPRGPEYVRTVAVIPASDPSL